MNKLDSSIIDNNPDYNDNSFISEIENKLSSILRRTFSDSYQKQRVLRDSSGFVFACPFCHDSATNSSKKRGHILLSGRFAGNFKCFNCGTFISIPKFMIEFNESLSLSGIKYAQEHRQNINTYTDSSSAEITADVFSKKLALNYGIDRTVFRDALGLSEIDQSYRGINGYNYLTNRMQYKFNNFLYDPNNNYVLILNLCENKIIGFQMRSLNKNCPKDKRFLTFNLDRMYKKIMKNTTAEIPADLNTISTLFNIYSINVYKPIIVTEGPMDAFLLPNAIATSGANKKLSVDLPFYYMYDADPTGNKRAIEKIRQHSKVFMWGKLKHELGLPKREKWDVNDVVLWCKENKPNYTIDWLKYFSDNMMDLIYLDDLSMAI
jgi:hypothetical protein